MRKASREIEEHFVKPFNEELDEEKGENIDIFHGCHPAEKRAAAEGRFETRGGDDAAREQEPAYTPPQDPMPYTPPIPLEYYQPRDDDVHPFQGDNLEDYTRYVLDQAGKRFERSYAEREANQRVETTETRAREVDSGRDGLPRYDDIIDGHVAPLI